MSGKKREGLAQLAAEVHGIDEMPPASERGEAMDADDPMASAMGEEDDVALEQYGRNAIRALEQKDGRSFADAIAEIARLTR